MSAVQVRHLCKHFVRRRKPPVAALDDVSFEMAPGECVAVLGQNGSGKSTLVRLLSTLLLPDGGTARVFGMTAADTRSRIPAILEGVGFPSDRRNESMENLSRGMQQKVALARA